MIQVANIVTSFQSSLDSQDSQYYLFQQDYLPAILAAQRLLVSQVDSLYADKRLSEEIFQDLLRVRVFQTSTFSRIQFTALAPDAVWTLKSVEPLPMTSPIFTATLPNAQQSFYRSDLSHVTSNFSATRTTIEERNFVKQNPFAAGHDLESGETAKTYGYILHNDYTSTAYTLTGVPQEIEVFPFIPSLPVTIRYIKVPTEPTLITDTLEFPVMFTESIVQAGLVYIGYKQGDGTTIEQLSSKMLSALLAPLQ